MQELVCTGNDFNFVLSLQNGGGNEKVVGRGERERVFQIAQRKATPCHRSIRSLLSNQSMPSLKQIEVEGGDLPTGTIGNVASGGGGEAKASKCRKEDDDVDDVDVMGVTTFDQQLARRKENAEKHGDMLNLCNDSDAEDTKSSAVKVKTEQTGYAEDTESSGGSEKKRKAPSKSKDSLEVDSTVKVKSEQVESKKKKRKQSILEMMNPDYVGKTDEKDVDSEKENNKKAKSAKSSSIKSSKKKKKPKSGADIRSFYSLSPKEEGRKSPMACEVSAKTPAEGDTTPKKRKQVVGKFIGLNDDAKALHIHIPFVGDEKNTAVTIDAHCVENKYDLSSPIVLTGKYSSRRRTKFQIESFLGGFGRYIH